MFLRETVSMKLSEGRRFIYATKACEANDRPYNARHRHRTGLELIMHQTEETLVLIKPDALGRGLVGEIIGRFERAGLKIGNVRLVCPRLTEVEKHYSDLKVRNARAFDRNTRYLAGKQTIAVVLVGVNAIAKVRALIGPTEPASAPPGTIRGDLSADTIKLSDAEDRGLYNLVHAAASAGSAKREIALWFC